MKWTVFALQQKKDTESTAQKLVKGPPSVISGTSFLSKDKLKELDTKSQVESGEKSLKPSKLSQALKSTIAPTNPNRSQLSSIVEEPAFDSLAELTNKLKNLQKNDKDKFDKLI